MWKSLDIYISCVFAKGLRRTPGNWFCWNTNNKSTNINRDFRCTIIQFNANFVGRRTTTKSCEFYFLYSCLFRCFSHPQSSIIFFFFIHIPAAQWMKIKYCVVRSWNKYGLSDESEPEATSLGPPSLLQYIFFLLSLFYPMLFITEGGACCWFITFPCNRHFLGYRL